MNEDFINYIFFQISLNNFIFSQDNFGAKFSYELSLPLAIEREPGVINKFVYNGLGTSSNQTLNVGGRFFSDNYFFLNSDFLLLLVLIYQVVSS